jgi:redox-sensitive bicupin YhaK (pirin superfamily)
MIIVRKSNERGRGQHDWLDSYHTFSFADYQDPKHMHFHSLRVINEDFIKPSFGFGKHPHQNMEIITYVISGTLAHKDSMGNGSIIKPGEIQKMSAGTGVEHSEFNPSPTEPLHLLQIWIIPNQQQLSPSYEQVTINKKPNEFILIGSPIKQEGAVQIHEQVNLYVAYLDANTTIDYHFENNQAGWIQIVKGAIELNNLTLTAGDGAAIEDESRITIISQENTELLLFNFQK